MRSVADDLRREIHDRSRGRSAAERVELALELGRRDLEVYRHARGMDAATATLEIRRRRRIGRQRSACIDALLA